MSFDQVSFWLFLPFAWLAWRALPVGAARYVLVALSLGFYAWWNPLYLLLIVGSAGVDYHLARWLERSESPGRRKALVTLSLTCNLGLLAVFKYTPFVVETAWALRGTSPEPSPFELWVVPVGISFYTFQTLSYTIDVYRRRCPLAPDFHTFLLYVAFFPQLVAGPIVRARSFLPQLQNRAPLTALRFRVGAYRCVEGLFLKAVVADGVAPEVIRVFDMQYAGLSPVGAWYGALLFGAQIFADFAGYTGIAIGVACLMGLRFPENFRAPYIAASPSEFWRRWHISLSTWLRDYLYVPLGGNRKGALRTYVNLMIVMLLGGLWHGASWNFVVWGGLHGVALAIGRALPRHRGGPVLGALRSLTGWLFTFAFVHVAWVFFRAREFDVSTSIVELMLVTPLRGGWSAWTDGYEPSVRFALLFVPIALLHGAQWAHERLGLRRSELLRSVGFGLMLFAITVVERRALHEFIYFQF